MCANKTAELLTARPVTEADARLLWEWVNDPEVRAASFDSHPIAWEEHAAWFRNRLHDPGCRIYIVQERGGHPIGQVRFDQSEQAASITVSVDRRHRHQGVGALAVELACTQFLQAVQVEQLIAYIKPHNRASQRVFEKAGFRHGDKTVIKEQEAVCLYRLSSP